MGKADVTFSLSSGFNSRLSHDLFIFFVPDKVGVSLRNGWILKVNLLLCKNEFVEPREWERPTEEPEGRVPSHSERIQREV